MEVFKECLRRQMQMHPSMLSRDVVKLCYQAACGAEHLLSDLDGARQYFDEEYASVSRREEPLYEMISEQVCRVNLGAWKHSGLPAEQLFRLFTETVFQGDGKNRLSDYLSAAETVLKETDFDMDAWHNFLYEYKRDGIPAVRHSEEYRKAEQPAYRIVSVQHVRRLNLQE